MSSRIGPFRLQASTSVTTRFSDLLTAAQAGERQLGGEGVLSLAMAIPSRDPMALLSQLEGGERFRFPGTAPQGLVWRERTLQQP